jgi:uncharacterized integral membrane protein
MADQVHDSSPARRHPRAIARIVGAAAVVVVFIVFLIENGNTVHIKFLFWGVNTSLSWALVVAGILGVIMGWLLPRVLRRLRR